MSFIRASWFLKSKGIEIERSLVVTPFGRLYKVWEPTSDEPAFWALPKVICSLANLAKNLDETEKMYAPVH